jgi:hypothetical protein
MAEFRTPYSGPPIEPRGKLDGEYLRENVGRNRRKQSGCDEVGLQKQKLTLPYTHKVNNTEGSDVVCLRRLSFPGDKNYVAVT